MFKVRISKFSVVFLVLGLLLPLAGVAQGADFTFKPRISTTMEYNDNVTETQNPKGDYIWIVKPGLSATYEHSRVLFDLSYDFQNKKYLDQVKSTEQNNSLSALGRIEAIKDLFFVNVTDSYKMVYQNVTRGRGRGRRHQRRGPRTRIFSVSGLISSSLFRTGPR